MECITYYLINFFKIFLLTKIFNLLKKLLIFEFFQEKKEKYINFKKYFILTHNNLAIFDLFFSYKKKFFFYN